MSFVISIESNGLGQQITQKFTNQAVLKDIYEAVGAVLEGGLAKQFQERGKYWNDDTWADLSESYKTLLERVGGYENLETNELVATLRRGRTGSEQLSGSFAYEFSANGLEFGLSASYAPYLHYGTDKMPERPILPESFEQLTERDKKEIVYVVQVVLADYFG